MQFSNATITIEGKINQLFYYLHALNFQLHMIFPRGFPVFSLLPAIPVPSVANLLTRVEEHGARLWPRFQVI